MFYYLYCIHFTEYTVLISYETKTQKAYFAFSFAVLQEATSIALKDVHLEESIL